MEHDLYADEDCPFYDPNEDLNIDTFLDSKCEDDEEDETHCQCGAELTKTNVNGEINLLCNECGIEINTHEAAEYVSQNKSEVTAMGSAPIIKYMKHGNAVIKRTHYSISSSATYRRKVKENVITTIINRSRKTGVDIGLDVAVRAAELFIKIRDDALHRANVKTGIIAACILNASDSISRDKVIKLMGVSCKYISRGEKIFTRFLRPFNIDDWMGKCENKLKVLLEQFEINTKENLSFVCNLVKFCQMMHIAVHSGDVSKCIGAVWFLIELRGEPISSDVFFKSVGITKNTVLRFVDDVKVMIWRAPLPNTAKFPQRFQRTLQRREQLRKIIKSYGFELPKIYNRGRFRKFYKAYNIDQSI